MNTEDSVDPPTNSKKIKHLVIPGGGVTGFSYYGTLSASAKKGIWDLKNIQSMYGTSVGAIIIAMLCLRYDWDILDDFLIKRPWQNVFKFDMYSVIGSMQKCGMFEQKVLEEFFLPLFSGRDLPIDITMADFYAYTNIDLHLFTTEIKTFQTIEISHSSHPTWTVMEAVYASCCLPIMFSPFFKDDTYYCDGGFLANYPIEHCLQNGADPDEILGIMRSHVENKNMELSKDSMLFDYALLLVNKTINNLVLINHTNYTIGIEYKVPSTVSSLYSIYTATTTVDERIRLINFGKQIIDKEKDQEQEREQQDNEESEN